MEAMLTWVKLKAELKNCRKVGRESLPLLGKENRGKRRLNRESRIMARQTTVHKKFLERNRWKMGQEGRTSGMARKKLIKSDRECLADEKGADREKM